MKKKINNNVDLRSELLTLFNELVNEENPDLKSVRTKCAAAGKILQSASLEVKYQELRGEKPECTFLES